LTGGKEKMINFLPVDSSLDTDEFGCTDEHSVVANKVNSIDIRKNNINLIDTRSREMLERGKRTQTEPDDGFSHYTINDLYTPKKKRDDIAIRTANSGYIFQRGSWVSQTTQNSSHNKKRFDLSGEHLGTEERLVVFII
jgi:hypothetical protein